MEAPPEIESSLGKYRLIASLARGGMARVYLTLVAGPADFNKLVVLKVLGDGVSLPPQHSVQMFMNEARLAARLVHPNIVHTYEVGESAGRFFIAMEYLEGHTYRAFMRRAGLGGVLLSEHLRILSELARGLHGLHNQTDFDGRPLAAVHRDVSPQNVLLGYDGQVKLLDFGIAETAETSTARSRAALVDNDGIASTETVDAIRGKLDYIAPEQLRGDSVDFRADLFSLGVMLYEALSERRFAGGMNVDTYEKVQRRLSGAELPLLTVAPDAPPELVYIAECALALDPQHRWESALAFAEALDTFAESLASPPRREALAWRMSQLFEKDRAALRNRVGREIERVRQGHFVELGTEGTGELPRLGNSERAPGMLDSSTGGTVRFAATSASEPVYRPTTAADTLPVPSSKSSRAPRIVVPARSWLVIASATAIAAVLAWQTTPSRGAQKDETASASVLRLPAEAPSASVLGAREASARAAVGALQRPEQPLQARPASSPGASGLVNTIRAQVAVTPAHATVRLDALELSTPVSAEFARDGKPHLLEASARGYAPYRALVVFDRDRVIDIVLETLRRSGPKERVVSTQTREETQETSPAPRAPSRPVVATPAEAEGPIEPGSKFLTRRRLHKSTIDTTDPYAPAPSP